MESGTAATWPRTSPPGLRRVCTFTYARPASSAARTPPRTVARPRAPLRHGPHSDTAILPAVPRRPRWMCAAIARPVSRENVSVHVNVAAAPSFLAVAVNVPRARRTAPFGLGTSWRDVIAVRADATDAIWPRISPGVFVRVWTFTYARPASIAASTASLMLAVPDAPLVHGAQNGTATPAAWPRGARWMWAAIAGPVRPLKVSRHSSFAPPEVLLTVAVNVPFASPTLPVGDGVSCAAVIGVLRRMVSAAPLRAAAPPAVTRTMPSAAATTRRACFLTFAPPYLVSQWCSNALPPSPQRRFCRLAPRPSRCETRDVAHKRARR